MAFKRSAVRSRLAPPAYAPPSGGFGWQASLRRTASGATVHLRRGRRLIYVYLLKSISFPKQIYVGPTDDLRARLAAHNAGQSPHTAKFKPWDLVTYIAFSDEAKAIAFERY